MNIKSYTYIASLLLALTANGCSNEEAPANEKQGLPIAGIALSMDGAEVTTKEVITRGAVTFAVNTSKDPTKAALDTRTGWKLDFTLYNGTAKYDASSFTGGTYNGTDKYWAPPTGGTTYYFPNYLSPGVELLLYPDAKSSDKGTISINQSAEGGTGLLSEDVLMQKNNKDEFPLITPAHIILNDKTNNNASSIPLVHKHAMLDFAITDINTADIATVKVTVGTTEYIPYEVPDLTGYKEYMLILPEGTNVDPVVHVTTTQGDETDAIRYKQEVNIISPSVTALGTNNCYCFTLKGKALELSPITIADWIREEAIQGEYIAVTAYPTFKAAGHANETFYFYYDNKLMESDGSNGTKAKLQKITFNQDAECTIKPDGRILTHIYAADQTEEIIPNGNRTPKANAIATYTGSIVLDQMVIDLVARKALTSNP